MARYSADINVMLKAAQKAARSLTRDFGEVEQLQVSRKGPGDFVSAADLRSEEIIYNELKRARPEHGFLMEESGEKEKGTNGCRWIVDPLDGTSNFLHGIPHWAISIGLEKEGEITAGVIFDPIKDELFWAERGAGAFMNSRRLRVSARDKMEIAMIAMGTPACGQKRDQHLEFKAELTPVMQSCAGTRRLGAAALDLAYVAAGRFEGYWERGIKAWDIAAGIIMVKEAGGYICDMDNGQNFLEKGHIIASNAALHSTLTKIVCDANKDKNNDDTEQKSA